MSTVVMSVYKVASFPDGGGHFWVYLQYALGLRRLGCEVYWLEQLRPARDPQRGDDLPRADETVRARGQDAPLHDGPRRG